MGRHQSKREYRKSKRCNDIGDVIVVIIVSFERKNEIWIVFLLYMRKERARNPKIIRKWMEQEKDSKIIMYGDLNVRTDTEGEIWDEDGEKEKKGNRNTMVNKEGKELIEWLEENRVSILNGEIDGDKDEDFTYLKAREYTVMNYMIKKRDGDKKGRIEINIRTVSDYLPVIPRRKEESFREESEENIEKKKRYKEKIRRICKK